MSEMAQFKLYVSRHLELRLNEFPDTGVLDKEDQNKPVEIVQITFAFDNGDLMGLLKKRGAAIKMENYDMLRNINDKIDKELEDESKCNKYQRPCSVFVTFETEEGYARAEKWNKLVNGV